MANVTAFNQPTRDVAFNNIEHEDNNEV